MMISLNMISRTENIEPDFAPNRYELEILNRPTSLRLTRKSVSSISKSNDTKINENQRKFPHEAKL